jgi:hypothetical protein
MWCTAARKHGRCGAPRGWRGAQRLSRAQHARPAVTVAEHSPSPPQRSAQPGGQAGSQAAVQPASTWRQGGARTWNVSLNSDHAINPQGRMVSVSLSPRYSWGLQELSRDDGLLPTSCASLRLFTYLPGQPRVPMSYRANSWGSTPRRAASATPRVAMARWVCRQCSWAGRRGCKEQGITAAGLPAMILVVVGELVVDVNGRLHLLGDGHVQNAPVVLRRCTCQQLLRRRSSAKRLIAAVAYRRSIVDETVVNGSTAYVVVLQLLLVRLQCCALSTGNAGRVARWYHTFRP